MVRFIIKYLLTEKLKKTQFTFQYGQIYYQWVKENNEQKDMIYIPIWLDLL